MKKGIVALLVILALVVLLSPGLIGRLAEKSVNDQLNWAAKENQEVVITSERFDRGWFSSQGRHRVVLGRTGPGAHVRQALGISDDDPTPTLIIDTRLDHGLIPVSSVTREEGSLAPGLGRAVSTLSVEFADGSVTEIPGTIFSSVGLAGSVTSHYFLEPGSSGGTSWGAADIELEADAKSGHFVVDGGFDTLTFLSPAGGVYSLGKTELSADATMTNYGYSVGDMAFAVDAVNLRSAETDVNVGPIQIKASSALNGKRVDSTMYIDFAMAGVPPVGDIGWSLELALDGLDATAVGRLQRGIEAAADIEDPAMLFAAVQNDLAGLVAAGFDLHLKRFDVTLPQGTLFTKMDVSLPESDPADFAWTNVLLDMAATAEIKVPAALYEFATTMNPQVNAAVAMGFLKKNGDMYEMAAEYRKGLLTINGAPMPIPLPGS